MKILALASLVTLLVMGVVACKAVLVPSESKSEDETK